MNAVLLDNVLSKDSLIDREKERERGLHQVLEFTSVSFSSRFLSIASYKRVKALYVSTRKRRHEKGIESERDEERTERAAVQRKKENTKSTLRAQRLKAWKREREVRGEEGREKHFAIPSFHFDSVRHTSREESPYPLLFLFVRKRGGRFQICSSVPLLFPNITSHVIWNLGQPKIVKYFFKDFVKFHTH